MEIDEKRFYSPKELVVRNGGVLPISVSAVYSAIRKNEIPSKRFGNRIMIPGWYIIELLRATEPDLQASTQ